MLDIYGYIWIYIGIQGNIRADGDAIAQKPAQKTGAETAGGGAETGAEFRNNTDKIHARYRYNTDKIQTRYRQDTCICSRNTDIVQAQYKHDTVHRRIRYIHIQANTCTF
jgi:hypothetical protein